MRRSGDGDPLAIQGQTGATAVDVNIVGGGGTGGTASDFGDPFPAVGTAAGFIDDSGDMAGASLDASGNLLVAAGAAFPVTSGLSLGPYDYVALVLTSPTVETYTFKSGGAGGTTIATITLTYTDASKAVLSTVVKT